MYLYTQFTYKLLNFPTLKKFITADKRLMEFYNDLSDSLQVYFTNLLEENVNEGNLAPFTVFAPDNEAFDDLIENIFGEDPEDWQDIDPDEMEDILNLHIKIGRASCRERVKCLEVSRKVCG